MKVKKIAEILEKVMYKKTSDITEEIRDIVKMAEYSEINSPCVEYLRAKLIVADFEGKWKIKNNGTIKHAVLSTAIELLKNTKTDSNSNAVNDLEGLGALFQL